MSPISHERSFVYFFAYSLYFILSYNFFFFRAASVAHGVSQARGLIGATAAGLRHSHSNMRSKLHLRLTPQLTATLGP